MILRAEVSSCKSDSLFKNDPLCKSYPSCKSVPLSIFDTYPNNKHLFEKIINLFILVIKLLNFNIFKILTIEFFLLMYGAFPKILILIEHKMKDKIDFKWTFQNSKKMSNKNFFLPIFVSKHFTQPTISQK